MDKVRNLAVRILSEVNEEGAYANVALARNLKKAELTEVDRRFLTELSYGAIKAGGFTSERERDDFVQKVMSMPEVKFCPHGRPVAVRMSRHQLEKQFKRS